MKTITIRECAIDACEAIHYSGAQIFFAICKEAITGEPINWEDFKGYGEDGLKALYKAIAPDILDSVDSEITYQEIISKHNNEAE